MGAPHFEIADPHVRRTEHAARVAKSTKDGPRAMAPSTDVWCFDVEARFERQGVASKNTLKCVIEKPPMPPPSADFPPRLRILNLIPGAGP